MPTPEPETGKSNLDRLLTELKRRRVYKVAVIYVAAGFALLQGLDIVLPALNAPDWVLRTCVIGILLGFPIALALAWVFDITGHGVERTADLPDGTATPLGRGTRLARVVGGLLLIGILLAGAGMWLRPRAAEGTVVAGADVIAVLPFRATGPDVGSLSEGMVDLLSTNLDQVGAIRTVPPRQVLRAWARRAEVAEIDQGAGLAIGAELGAGSVLTGSVTQAGAEARLTAELHTTRGNELARVTVNGQSGQVLSLVDSLSFALLREVWRSREPVPSFDVSRITTSSLDAVRSYLRGEAAYRRSSWDEAIAEYEEAVRFDSTFALAHVRLGSSHGWREQLGVPAAREHVDAALRFADRLPERDRQLVAATGLWYRDDRQAAVDTLNLYVERFPDDPDGWFLLGDIEFHRPDNFMIAPEHFYPPFEKVLELDPTLTPALFHPIDLALGVADSARFFRYVDQMEAGGGNRPTVDLLRRAGAVTWPEQGRIVTLEDMTALAQMTFEVRPSAFQPLSGAAFYSARGAPNEFVDGLLSIEESFQSLPGGAATFAFAGGPLLTALGRMREARPWIEKARALQPVFGDFMQVSALAAGFASASDPDWALDAGSSDGNAHALAQALALLGAGDASAARTAIADLPDDPRVRESLSGWADLMEGDTVGGIGRLEQGLAALDQDGSGLNPAAFEAPRYRMLDAKARQPETRQGARVELLTRRWSDLHYISLRHLTAAEIAAEEGNASEATRHYRRFLRILERADPALDPFLQRARAGLEQVER